MTLCYHCGGWSLTPELLRRYRLDDRNVLLCEYCIDWADELEEEEDDE